MQDWLGRGVVGGYLNRYESGSTLGEIPSEYSLIFCSPARGNGTNTGAISFIPGQGTASFVADLAVVRARGQRVVMSIGSADDNGLVVLDEDNVQELLASIATILQTYAFDGIDLNIENDEESWNTASILSLVSQVKATYSPEFLVTVTPQPAVLSWKSCAAAMGDNLDLFTQQFYDYPATDSERIAGIAQRINQAVNTYGIPARKLGVGCRTVNASSPTLASSPEVYREGFDDMRAVHPGLCTAVVWTVGLDETDNYAFAETFADLISSPVPRGSRPRRSNARSRRTR